jgi:hypothetical protein
VMVMIDGDSDNDGGCDDVDDDGGNIDGGD